MRRRDGGANAGHRAGRGPAPRSDRPRGHREQGKTATGGHRRTEFAAFIGPLVPDAHAIFLKVGDIGVALQEPQQLVDDRAQVELFGGQAWEALTEIVANLTAEDGVRAGAGTIQAFLAVLEDIAKEIEVGFHADTLSAIFPS